MKLEILAYNDWHDVREGDFVMPKRKVQSIEDDGGKDFGKRLARFRQAAGYSQRELAAEIGISYRMVAYYEKEAGHLPTDLLPVLSKVLGVSTDQLLGVEEVKEIGRNRDSRLWRRFSQLEKLPSAQRKPIVQVIDAFLEREKLKKAS